MSPIGHFASSRLPPIALEDIREEKSYGYRNQSTNEWRPITAEARPGISSHGRRPLSIVSQITALRSSKNIMKGITGHAPPTYRKSNFQLTEPWQK